MAGPLAPGSAQLTNFNALTTEQKTMWSMQFWKMARNNSYIAQFAGRGPNSMVQRITELKKSEKGARAVITLIADIEGDGVTGDYTLEGNEEPIKAYDQVIRIDQLRNANRLEGRLADQKSIVNFRTTSRDVLAYWAADRVDQLAFLTLSGVDYTVRNNGATRPVNPTGQNLGDLEYAADVGAPTADRHFRWDASSGSWAAGDTAAVCWRHHLLCLPRVGQGDGEGQVHPGHQDRWRRGSLPCLPDPDRDGPASPR